MFYISIDLHDDDPDVVNYGVQPAAIANEMQFLSNYMTLHENERILIGHDFNSFIKSCNFRGKNCRTETYVALVK